MSEEEKYPKIIAGALIANHNGKILLGKGTKWNNKYTIPGGHIEYGEKIEEALKREIKEETDIQDIKIIDSINIGESIFSDEYHKKKHLIFIDFLCDYEGGDDEIKQKEKFNGNFKWFTPEEALKLDLAINIDNLIKKYIDYKNSKEYLNNWKRAQADFENYKKDQTRKMEEFRKFATLDLVFQILPVLDSFESSLAHVPEDQKESAWVGGVLHIKKQLEELLRNSGVEEIEAKAGDEFNPAIHEAVQGDTNDVNKNADDANMQIKSVLRKGYKLNGKVIRAARIIVE